VLGPRIKEKTPVCKKYKLYKSVRQFQRSELDFYLFLLRCSLIFASQPTSCASPTCLLRRRKDPAALGPTHSSRRVSLTFLHHVLNVSTVSHANLLFRLTLLYKVATTSRTVTAKKKNCVAVMTAWVREQRKNFLKSFPLLLYNYHLHKEFGSSTVGQIVG